MRLATALLTAALLAGHREPRAAQDKGTVNPKPLPPLANPDDPKNPAKELFARKPTAANMQARSIGFYTRGCLAGGVALPINGKTWQVMRLSRARNWGHPDLVAFMERLAEKVPKVSNWPGLLVGDMAQARGGPMLTGHTSHQVGLDADIWLTPMPKTPLSREEREEMSATNVVAERQEGRRSEDLDGGPLRGDQGGGRGPEGRAHLRQRGDQEGAVPRGRQGSRLPAQGAPVVGAQLSFPRAHRLPGRQPGMQGAGPGGRGGRLRQGPRLLVQPGRAQPAAAEGAAQAAPAAHDGGPAGGMPAGAGGAVGDSPLRRLDLAAALEVAHHGPADQRPGNAEAPARQHVGRIVDAEIDAADPTSKVSSMAVAMK